MLGCRWLTLAHTLHLLVMGIFYYVVMHTDSRLGYVMPVSLADVSGGNADSATLNHPD